MGFVAMTDRINQPLLQPLPAGSAPLLVGDDTPLPVPSGQVVTLLDVIGDAPGPAGATLRFRFLAPQIARTGGRIGFEQAAADMQALCDSFALPRLAELGPRPSQIIISFSDIPVPFGATMPEATQYIEAFSVRDNACIWEVY